MKLKLSGRLTLFESRIREISSFPGPRLLLYLFFSDVFRNTKKTFLFFMDNTICTLNTFATSLKFNLRIDCSSFHGLGSVAVWWG